MKVLTYFALTLSAASLAFGQSLLSVQKSAQYIQTSATGAVSASTVGFPAYDFSAQTNQSSSQTGSFTPPGLSAITIPYNTSQGGGLVFQTFPSLSALNAPFPSGNYTIGYTGIPTITIPLSSDSLYSAIPQLTGGTWQNNVLVVDPTKPVVLNFTPFATYGSTTGGQAGAHEALQVQSTSSGNLNLKQDYITASVGGGGFTVTSTPFTSYTVPAGSFQAGNLYQVTLDYDVITKLDTTTVSGVIIAGIYENELNFYISAPATSNPVAAPTIVFQPINVTAPLGGSATIEASYSPPPGNNGGPGTNAGWYFNLQEIQSSSKYLFNFFNPSNNVSAAYMTITGLTAGDAGTYVFEVTNASGLVYSQPVTVTIGPAAAPTIIGQPSTGFTVPSGGSATLSVGAVGAGPLSYQWSLNGKPISSATQSSLSISNASAASAGTYTVAITNSGGTTTSTGTVVTVPAANSGPLFTTKPVGQTVVAGSTVVFTAVANGNPTPTYQWTLQGVNIVGATNSRLVVTASSVAGTYNYGCIATNSVSTAIAPSVPLVVLASTPSPGRLINLSVNTVASNSQVLTVGVVVGGAASGTQPLLIRATGPALANLGVAGTISDPTLSVLSGSNVIASNDNWGTPATNVALVNAADSATFAFPLTSTTSLDAALVTALAPAGYTVKVSGNGTASGVTLAEVYDDTANFTTASPRLVNVSCNDFVAANGSLTAGFQVGGTTSKTVLIRATGPALIALGVSNTMPDPQLTLHTTINGVDTVLASNAGWGGDSQITTVSNSVFAFAIKDPASKDSVILTTLAPGGYTAIATSATGTAGVTIVEVYEVP